MGDALRFGIIAGVVAFGMSAGIAASIRVLEHYAVVIGSGFGFVVGVIAFGIASTIENIH